MLSWQKSCLKSRGFRKSLPRCIQEELYHTKTGKIINVVICRESLFGTSEAMSSFGMTLTIIYSRNPLSVLKTNLFFLAFSNFLHLKVYLNKNVPRPYPFQLDFIFYKQCEQWFKLYETRQSG